MAKRPRRNKVTVQVPQHPVVPGSTLYRALQQVARAVAEKLAEREDVDRPGDEHTKNKIAAPDHR